MEESYSFFFEYNRNLLTKITNTYNLLTQLYSQRHILRSYLHKIEMSLTEDKEDLIDDNQISLKNLRNSLEAMNKLIREHEKFLKENEMKIDTLEKFSLFRDVMEDCRKVKYRFYDCEICNYEIRCQGYKNNKNRSKFLGNFLKLENNVIHYQNGGNCYYYNKKYSAKIYLECGYTDKLEFKTKINACHYEFIYTTKIACNTVKLNQIRDRINLILKDI